MKRYLILLLLMANLGLGVQSFAVMTKDERIKLEDQIDEAYEKEDEEKLLLLITKYVKEFPNNAEYLNRLGVLYDNKENYSEAEVEDEVTPLCFLSKFVAVVVALLFSLINRFLSITAKKFVELSSSIALVFSFNNF